MSGPPPPLPLPPPPRKKGAGLSFSSDPRLQTCALRASAQPCRPGRDQPGLWPGRLPQRPVGPDGVGKIQPVGAGGRNRRVHRAEWSASSDGEWPNPRHRRQVCPRIAYMPQGWNNSTPTLPRSNGGNAIFSRACVGLGRAERRSRSAALLGAHRLGLRWPARRPAFRGTLSQKLGLVLRA